VSDKEDISVDRVKAIDAFSGLSEEQLQEVAGMAAAREYDEGSELLRQADWPEDLLAIEQGDIEVRRDDEVLATLGAGDVVGERGVVNRALRNASVIATSDVKLLFFHRNKIKALKSDVPEIGKRLKDLADEREQ
jgi:CRP-like cAMP-binding protein